MGNVPSLKVTVPFIVGLIATVVLAISQQWNGKLTLATAAATAMQAIIGYITPHVPVTAVSFWPGSKTEGPNNGAS